MEFNYKEKQAEFNSERRRVKQEYENEVTVLQAELHAKILKLQNVRDGKLQDINRREDKFVREYRLWKQNNWMADNNHRLDNPEPKQP